MSLNPFRWKLSEWRGFNGKVKLCLQRHYVSQGKAVMGFAFGFIALFGIASGDWKKTLMLGVLYYIFCYFVGRYWCNHHWMEAETEIGNKFNLFVREMRTHVKKQKI